MHHLLDCEIEPRFSAHYVGNKGNDEFLKLSEQEQLANDDLIMAFRHFFLEPFKSEEYFSLYHESDLMLNEVFCYVKKIFEDPSQMHEQSQHLAKHLYKHSLHPKINGGEFYLVYLKNCYLEGEVMDAVGMFKSESKDTFLDVVHSSAGINICTKEGVNINKLDKGCIIFNTDEDKGYVVASVDTLSRGQEAQYWKDDFLNLRVLGNQYHQTQEFLGITKAYVNEQLNEEFAVAKADQIDLLNRSMEYFKNNETFNKTEFKEAVFQNEELISSFNRFDEQYRQENEIEIEEDFKISSQAVKKQSKGFKSVLKLDKNFHIYIHGNKDLIEQGTDERGRKFYKIYYQEEK